MLRSITVLILAVSALSGQTFETATVTPSAPQDDDAPRPTGAPGQMVYTNVSLKSVLVAAYRVRPDQISGPAWLDTERYDIVAKAPAGASKDQVPVMLQNLLADRFHMTVHVEDRPRTGYALVPGESGPKLKPVREITGVRVSVGADKVQITGTTVAAFASLLSTYMGRPIADLTEIQGSYDITLNVSMADLKAASGSIFSALEELGLKLESRTTTAKYVVVDKAEKIPTEN